MKKDRVITIVAIALAVILVVSVWFNISGVRHKNWTRKVLISDALGNLAMALDRLNLALVDEPSLGETYAVEAAADCLAKADRTIRLYHSVFLNDSNFLYPSGTITFDFIAYTLGNNSGSMDDMRYDGVLLDGVISDNEIQFLSLLRDDLTTLSTKEDFVKNHPNYKHTSEADKKNAFDAGKLVNRRLKLKPGDMYKVYEHDATGAVEDNASDADLDIFNYDDLDDPDAYT